ANSSESAPFGAVQVFATSKNNVTSQEKSATGGVLAGVNVMKSTATVAGRTLASFDGDIPLTFFKTASLTVHARGRNQAIVDAGLTQVSLGLLGGVNLADAEVTSSASTTAQVPSDASITVSGAVMV